MLYKTIVLVCVSFLLCFSSLFLVKKELGEPYPFFHYKLYSRPNAMNGFSDAIGIYSGEVRLNNIESGLYNVDDLRYQLTYILSDTVKDKDLVALRLKTLFSTLYTDYHSFNIYRETHVVNDYMKCFTNGKKELLFIVP